MAFKVFLSHSMDELDEDLVNDIELLLGAFDIDVYIAEDRPEYNEYVSEKIKKHIDSSDLLVGLFTKSGSNSGFVHQEIGYAEGKELPLVILKEEGVKSKGFFYGRDVIDFDPYDDDSLDDALEELEDFVLKLRRKKRIQTAAIIGIGAATGLTALGGYLLYRAFKDRDEEEEEEDEEIK